MPTGTVKWFNASKGFGFITVEDGADLFVHQSNVLDNVYGPLRDGQPVEFVLGSGPKGSEAVEVRATAAAPVARRPRPEDRPFSSPHRDRSSRDSKRPRK